MKKVKHTLSRGQARKRRAEQEVDVERRWSEIERESGGMKRLM
jgi:hypothetical protein